MYRERDRGRERERERGMYKLVVQLAAGNSEVVWNYEASTRFLIVSSLLGQTISDVTCFSTPGTSRGLAAEVGLRLELCS